MSDVPQGPDWWRASNGLYYPPEAKPGQRRPERPDDVTDADVGDMPSPPDEPQADDHPRDPDRLEPGADATVVDQPVVPEATVVGATGTAASGWDAEPADQGGWADPDEPLDGPLHDDLDDEPSSSRGWMLPAAIGVVVLALLIGGAVWWLLGDDDDTATPPDTTDAPTTTDPDDAPTTTDDPSTTDTTEDSGEVSAFDIGVGDCFDTTEVSGSDGLVVTTVALVECDEPHRAEVFAVETLEADATDPFPGTDERDEAAQALCEPGFEEFVGVSVAESELVLLWLAPTSESWADGDREVTCAAAAPDGETLTESVAGSER